MDRLPVAAGNVERANELTVGISSLLFAGALATAGLALALAAWNDVRSFTIPNRFCALIVAAYPLALVEMPPAHWIGGVIVGAGVLVVGSALFAKQWVGGGDVKLASATALWAGPAFADQFLVVTSMACALLAAALIATPLRGLLGAAGAPMNEFHQPMPFGVPIAAGGLWVLSLHFASL